jgi:hypothetical protein
VVDLDLERAVALLISARENLDRGFIVGRRASPTRRSKLPLSTSSRL